MGQLGLAAAFLGGALTLLSPCSALLLPSFFAYAFSRPLDLAARTVVFWVGLSVTLVPLGMGSALISRLFYGHREQLIVAAGWLIIAMGLVQILGRGFAFPGADRLRSRVGAPGGRPGWVRTFVLGAVYGLAGFCSGPVLGSVLTIAAAQGHAFWGGLLLAAYALGMAAPLFVLAVVWDRLQLGRRRWLRGRPVRLGRLQLHTSQLLSGAVFVGIGWVFLRYDGTAGITGMLGLGDTTGMEFGAQQWLTRLSRPGLDLAVLIGVAAVLAGVIALRWRRLRRARRSEGRPERRAGAAGEAVAEERGAVR